MSASRSYGILLSLSISASLVACPDDGDRVLLPGSGGNFMVGGSSYGAGEGGVGAENPGGNGAVGANGGTNDNGGGSGNTATGGDAGTTVSGGSGGSGGTTVLPECRGARCSCFGDEGVECAGENCCSTRNVPSGSFSLGGDAARDDRIETFGLDEFEVTVGRFRKFIENYPGPPQAEAGQHSFVVASGWRGEWDPLMATDSEELVAELHCHETQSTWTEEPGANESRPMNCVTWFEAFAFCAWDGGRLPTEAEWEYAASGGSDGLAFPWGSDAPDDDLALFECGGRPLDECAATDLLPVGSKPSGTGRFFQTDLAGSLAEWVLDWHAPYVESCLNCAAVDGGTERVMRGGSFLSVNEVDLAATTRANEAPRARFPSVGFRCARSD